MDEIIIARITVRSKILWIIYFKFFDGLCRKYQSDQEILRYIDINPEEAWSEAVKKNKDGYYILNVVSVDHFVEHGFDEELPKELLECQLIIYNPLIQRFIADAATRTLEKVEFENQKSMTLEEEIISRIEVRSKILLVVYNKCLPGLYRRDTSDNEIGEYIKNNLEEAFSLAIQKHKDGYYILNIASVENLGAFNWGKLEKNLLNSQLEIYNPLIQKFIADAATRTMELE